jgi:hypothetical protein
MLSLLLVTAGISNLGQWRVAGGQDVRWLMAELRESRENSAEGNVIASDGIRLKNT